MRYSINYSIDGLKTLLPLFAHVDADTPEKAYELAKAQAETKAKAFFLDPNGIHLHPVNPYPKSAPEVM